MSNFVTARRAVRWFAWVAWTALLAASVAVFVNTVLSGRTPLMLMVRGWMGSLALTTVSCCMAAWWLVYAYVLERRGHSRRVGSALIPAVPLLFGTTIPLAVIYLSDLANHYFYYSMVNLNQAKTLSLLLILVLCSMLLQLTYLESTSGASLLPAFENALARTREPLILTLLAGLGTLQGSSYLDRLFADFILRYWPIADAISTGVPYPAAAAASVWSSQFTEGGLSKYVIDLPLYPVMVAASFATFGHNVVGAYAPTVVSNVLLPPVTYLLFREVMHHRSTALSLAALVVLFPPFRFYVLNLTIPDATFFCVLLFSCWLFVKIVKGDRRKSTWGLFGLSAAATTLTRPEGAAYAGIYLLTALSLEGSWRQKALSLSLFVVPVGAFSMVTTSVFGVPWPSNWVGSLGVQNLLANWSALSEGTLQLFAYRMRLSTPELLSYSIVLLLAGLIGSFPCFYRPRRISALFLPVWINLLSVFLVDPRVSGASIGTEFFRHVSYVLPLLALAAAMGARGLVHLSSSRAFSMAAPVALNALLIALVLWSVHLLSKPSLNFGNDAGNLLGDRRLNLIDVASRAPFDLPVFTFEKVDGLHIVAEWRDTVWGYPDWLDQFLSSFDAVRRTSGTTYQAGSLLVYLAALALSLLPTRPGSVTAMAGRLVSTGHRLRLETLRMRDLLLALAIVPGLVAIAAVLLLARLASRLQGPHHARSAQTPSETATASILIAGQRDVRVARECIDSVVEAVRFDGAHHEVIVIDADAAETGRMAASPELGVRLVAAGGDRPEDNWRLGIEAASRDVVVLLAGNALVERDFLRPLLSCFEDPRVFAVASRIYHGDNEIPRAESPSHNPRIDHQVTRSPEHQGASESQPGVLASWCPGGHGTDSKTGKTRGEVRNGEIRLWHAPWPAGEVSPQPVLWASRHGCAYHRARFLELGGFDPLFSDTEAGDADLCFRAWKRGWRVLLEDRSVIRYPTPPPLGGQPLPSDLLERDRILLGWKTLASARRLIGCQLALAVRLLVEGSRGRLNLRPLRYALGGAVQLLRRVLAVRPDPLELSDEEVFRASSHRYFLKSSLASEQAQETSSRAQGTGNKAQGKQETGDWELGAAAAGGSSGIQSPASSRSAASSAQYPLITHHSSLITPLRILLVCPQLPYPPVHGAAVRMWNLLKALAARHRVDLLSFAEPGLGQEEVAASVRRLQPYCGTVRIVVRRPVFSRPSPLDRTIHVEMFDCPEMREALLDMVDRTRYDIIQFDKTELGQYALPPPAPVQLLVEHIIFYHAFRRQFLSWRRPSLSRLIDYLKLRRYELDVCRRCDGIVTMSRVDAEFLRARLPSHPSIVEVPNGVDTDYYRYAPDLATGNDLLFIGNFEHSPNVEGMAFFLARVFPLIRASAPEVRLLVVGPDPHRLVQGMAQDPSVIVTGLVEDTRPYMEKCSVFVAPILAGSGTRLKILEAMSSGIPVVSTTIGAEGLETTAGTHLLIADDPVGFAKRVVTLLRQPDLRQRLRAKARSLVEERYDWEIVGGRLERLYGELRSWREGEQQ